MNAPNSSIFEKFNNWIKQSISIRLFTIGILILLLLIPVSMVENLIREREYRQKDAIQEVSSKWGEQQTITGLVLTIPYKSYSKIYEGENNEIVKLVETREYAHFLPDQLNIKSSISPEVRYRGIYEVIVYNSKINLDGAFSKPSFEEWTIDSADVLWEDAFISLGISDLRSIQKNISLKWDDKEFAFNPGVESNDVISNGISTRINSVNINNIQNSSNFSIDINLNGSTSLNFIPLGKITKVDLTSPWKTPSFIGSYLPDHRKIDSKGFTANWEVLHLNRSFPQSFKGETTGIQESSFGVDLIVPVDEYQKSMRSAKYAVIFITLTFLIFFFVQVINGIRIHPIQYIIVGLALCVFYTLLIALSEHISFMIAYLLSSISIIGLISFYAKSIFKNNKLTLLIALILTVLYLFIYSIIQMEDYALLMGSIGLFLVLSVIIYLSRKIDWYSLKSKGNQ